MISRHGTMSRERAARGEDELLAMVYEDPEADAPREVYADRLLERGDPRGELTRVRTASARSAACRGAGPTS